MSGRTGPNHPGHPPVVDKVRQLQRRLWVAAKRSPERRFHALMDRIWRADILQEAWQRVKRNRGAAGVDRETLTAVEQYGVERMLEELGTRDITVKMVVPTAGSLESSRIAERVIKRSG